MRIVKKGALLFTRRGTFFKGKAPKEINLTTFTVRTARKGAPLLTLKGPILVDKLRRITRKRSPPTRRLGNTAKKLEPCESMRRSISVVPIAKVADVSNQQYVQRTSRSL